MGDIFGCNVIHFAVLCVRDAYLKVKNLQVNVELGVVAALIPLVKPILSIQDVSECGCMKQCGVQML